MFANIYETAKDVSFCVAGCTGMLFAASFFLKLTLDMISKVYYLYRTLGKRGKEFFGIQALSWRLRHISARP
jgi:hypothetical protein